MSGIDATRDALRPDLAIIADWVAPATRVLDIGCSDGALLQHLRVDKQVDGRGIEVEQEKVRQALRRGVPVVQGDANIDLADYPDDAFDTVILSQTLQAMARPRDVLQHMARIGRQVIVSFPNFGFWRVRLHLLLKGRMPVTRHLPISWYDTPNIHFCTIADFTELAGDLALDIRRWAYLTGDGRVKGGAPGVHANLFGEQGLFLLERKTGQ